MNNQEVSEILTHVGFKTEEEAAVLELARLGKQARLEVIRNEEPKNAAVRQECAAIEIGRFWRGYRCRVKIKELFAAVKPMETSIRQSDKSKPHYSPSVNVPVSIETTEQIISATISPEKLDHEKQPTSFQVIHECPEETEEGQTMPLVSEKVETTENVLSSLPTKAKRVFTRRQAATLIQKAWRRHIDTQVFHYYRDLINFRRQGNPALMLRCINPAEAKLLDAATGTHIKFRLAGEKFPPNIYYKIFTHRPVIDMCANSPKDYTRPYAKQANFKQLHTKNQPLPDQADTDGWYQRYENNGWRLVSDRLIHAAMDPTTWETANKKVEFHHSKLVRQADIDKRRREKKIAWMHKMYKKGLLQVKVEDPETNELVKKAADGLIHTVDTQGAEGVMDWEVDELLQWTTALNFDDYLEGWKESATSNISEFEVEEMMADKASKAKSELDVKYVSYSIFNETSAENIDKTQNFNTIQVPQT